MGRTGGARGRTYCAALGMVVGSFMLAAAAAAGCSSSSGASGGPSKGDSGTGNGDTSMSDAPSGNDATTDAHNGADSNGTDSTGGGDGPSGDGGASTACPSDGAVPPDASAVVCTVDLPNQVTALGVNNTTNVLYAPMADINAKSAGIAVVDTNTNAVTTTIPPVMTDAGSPVAPYFFDQMIAVDETANLVYAGRQFSSVIDVFDGATNAYKTSFDVAVLDTSCNAGVLGVRWLAIDPGRSRLYASCPGPASNTVEIAVLSTTGGTYTLSASIALSDLQSSVGALALDTTNQLLFVSNSSPNFGQSPAPPLLVDQIDTTTNQENAGAQQSLGAGTSVGTLGTAGFATLVAVAPVADAGPDAGASGTFFSLEPGSAQFPPDFEPTRSAAIAPVTGKPGYFYVVGNDFFLVPTPRTVEVQISGTEGTKLIVSGSQDWSTPLPPSTAIQVGAIAAGHTFTYLTGFAYPQGGGSQIIPGVWVCFFPH